MIGKRVRDYTVTVVKGCGGEESVATSGKWRYRILLRLELPII